MSVWKLIVIKIQGNLNGESHQNLPIASEEGHGQFLSREGKTGKWTDGSNCITQTANFEFYVTWKKCCLIFHCTHGGDFRDLWTKYPSYITQVKATGGSWLTDLFFTGLICGCLPPVPDETVSYRRDKTSLRSRNFTAGGKHDIFIGLLWKIHVTKQLLLHNSRLVSGTWDYWKMEPCLLKTSTM